MATKTVSAAGGIFTATTTWVGGVAPVANDDIVANATSGNLTLNANTVSLTGANFTGYTGTLALASNQFISSGTVTLGSGMTITGTLTSARITPPSAVPLTIVSNGVKIPGVGTSGGATVTLTGTASIGYVFNNGTLTGANIIYYGTSLPSGTVPLIPSPYILYIKPDTSVQFGSTTALISLSPRVIFDTTNVVDTNGPILVGVSASSIGFLQKPNFIITTGTTQSTIFYQPTTGVNTHTLDIGSSAFKLDRLSIQNTSSSISSSTFTILSSSTASFGLFTITPLSTSTSGTTPTTSIVSSADVSIDELVIMSDYSRVATTAGAPKIAIRNSVKFSAGVTYSISSLSLSGVSGGKTTVSSITSSVPATFMIGSTYSIDNTDITDINNVGSTAYAFSFSNNTLTRTIGITSSFPSSGGAGGSYTFVS